MKGEIDLEKLRNKAIKIGIIAVIVFIALGTAWYIVPKGSNGCIFNNIKGWNYMEKEQGWHLKIPIIESVNKMSFRTATLGIYAGGKGQYGVLTPKDKNGINYNVDVTIRYRMDRNQICEFIEQKGKDAEPLVLTALRADSTRGIFGKYAQEDVPEKRIEIAEEVRAELQKRLNREKSGKLKENFVLVEAVDIRNIEFNDKIETAIVEKQTAKQEAQKQEYRLQEEQKKKEIKIVQAEATKEALILEAKGRADAILLEATAKARGIDKINIAYQGMPVTYVEVKYAEALKEIAQEGNTVVMDLGRFQSGTNLGFLDYNKLMGIPQVRRNTEINVTG